MQNPIQQPENQRSNHRREEAVDAETGGENRHQPESKAKNHEREKPQSQDIDGESQDHQDWFYIRVYHRQTHCFYQVVAKPLGALSNMDAGNEKSGEVK